jgi:hypothetical protein
MSLEARLPSASSVAPIVVPLPDVAEDAWERRGRVVHQEPYDDPPLDEGDYRDSAGISRSGCRSDATRRAGVLIEFLTVLVDPCRLGFAPPVPESERSGCGNPPRK